MRPPIVLAMLLALGAVLHLVLVVRPTMAVACAAGCWGLLRGAPGDTAAPISDSSRVIRHGPAMRRLAGALLACWGLWLFIEGLRDWGLAADGLSRMVNLMFIVGVPLWFGIGLAIVLRRGRGHR